MAISPLACSSGVRPPTPCPVGGATTEGTSRCGPKRWLTSHSTVLSGLNLDYDMVQTHDLRALSSSGSPPPRMGKGGKTKAGEVDTQGGGGRGKEGQQTWAPILKLPPAVGPLGLRFPHVSSGVREGVTWGDYTVGSPNNRGKLPGRAHHVLGPVRSALENLAGFVLTVRKVLTSPLLSR